MIYYKYQPINQYLFSNLINSQIYFSQADKFNDPYDSVLSFAHQGTYNEWVKFFEGVSIQERGFVDPEKMKHLLSSLHKHSPESELLISTIPGFQQEETGHSDMLLVASFSKVRDNILMWSHYGNLHKGICLGYEAVRSNGFDHLRFFPESFPSQKHDLMKKVDWLLRLQEVEYNSDYPEPLNRLKPPTNDVIKRFALRKHNNWEYEDESRIVITKDFVTSQLMRLNFTQLREVIFGVQVDQQMKETIRKIIEEHYLKKGAQVRIYQAKMDKHRYALILNEEK